MSLCLFVSLCVCPCICLYVCLMLDDLKKAIERDFGSIGNMKAQLSAMSLSVCVYVCLSVCLSVYMSLCLCDARWSKESHRARLWLHREHPMSPCVSICLCVCLSVSVCVYVSVYISVCVMLDDLKKAIERDFGSIENMKTQLSAMTVAVQGSGWGWLGYSRQTSRLQLTTTLNQDLLEPTTG